MNQHISQENNLTYVAIAALAFIVACVMHEVIGHAGACIGNGSKIVLLTSVYFQCVGGSVTTDIAGPLANLLLGGVCYIILLNRHLNQNFRLFILLTMAFNLFWCAGCMLTSATTNKSDFAYLLTKINHKMVLFARIGLFLAGIFLYLVTLKIIIKNISHQTSLLVSYVSAGVVSCIAALFYIGDILPALREAALESFGSAVGLLYVHFKCLSSTVTNERRVSPALNFRWLIASVIIAVIFFLFLGRGITITNT